MARSQKKNLKINTEALLPKAGALLTADEIRQKFGPAETLGAPASVTMAQDSALMTSGVYTLLQHSMEILGSYAYPEFLGYGYLSGLTQNPLIRTGVEMIADEMTREGGKIIVSGDTENKTELDSKVAELTTDLKRFKIKTLLHDCSCMLSYFGGCLVFIDTGETDPAMLRTPLYLDSKTFSMGSLKGFKIIEPFNVAPGYYDTSNPLSADYFKPQSWWIQGREVHASRFLYFASELPPTLLRAAYNFFGIPLAQRVLDPVMHFTECRECTARLLKKFSLTVLKTNMSAVLQGGGTTELDRRIQYMVQNRDNDGVEVIDQESEDILKLETPLGGLTDIVRQCMEIVAAYFGEPAVKLWGISPNGFNATGDSDMRNHYDHVASQQEKQFREPIDTILRILQINRYGAIDESITYEFNPVAHDDESAIESVNKTKADTAALYLNNGILSPDEVRKRLTEDPKSGYNDIDPDDVPEQEEDGLDMSQSGAESDIENNAVNASEQEQSGAENDAENSETETQRTAAQ